MSEGATEISRQTQNPVQYDADYVKLRLDTQQLHNQILYFLEGKRAIMEFDENSNTWSEKAVPCGQPLANARGVQSLLSLVTAIINPHTIQGNTKREILNTIMLNLDRSISKQLTLNYNEWGIHQDSRDLIADTILEMIHLILTRTIDNLERPSYSPTIEKVSHYTTNEKKKGIL